MTANIGQSWSGILGVLCDSSKNEDCDFEGFSGANTGRLTCDIFPVSLFTLGSRCLSLFINTFFNIRYLSACI